MPVHKLYVNISSEQDLITLLGSRLVEEFRDLDIGIHGLMLGPNEDPGLKALLARHNIPLRHFPYTRSPACRALAGFIRRLRKLHYYDRSGLDSTLYAKSRMGYRNGTYSLAKFHSMKILSKGLSFLRLLHPLVIGAYHGLIKGLGALDAPVISLDYIHNDDHLELSHFSRQRGEPYITYVANLDQITNYDIHLDVVDQIMVWGEFHKRVFTSRYGLPAGRITKVGFCRSDLISGVSKPASGALNVVYFCANTPANDPFLEENLRYILSALEQLGRPYDFTLKKHPVNEKDVWERYVAAMESTPLRHGKAIFVASTWDKYRKLDQSGLEDRDFSYRDLRALFGSASHVFSATSTTTLEAAIAGAPAFFLNLGHKLDGCFAFEHMRILMESGMVAMITDPTEFKNLFESRESGRPPENALIENIGTASRSFARAVDTVLFRTSDRKVPLFPTGRGAGTGEPVNG